MNAEMMADNTMMIVWIVKSLKYNDIFSLNISLYTIHGFTINGIKVLIMVPINTPANPIFLARYILIIRSF